MNLPKVFGGITLLLFGMIFFTAKVRENSSETTAPQVQEIALNGKTVESSLNSSNSPGKATDPIGHQVKSSDLFPKYDRIDQLFTLGNNKLPIVETVTYKSHVPWMKGRQAWLVDYASHHKTSRHFIARSLNNGPDYLTQNVSEGNRFNVLTQDKEFSFHLLVDASRCKMLFYYVDEESGEKVFLKTYTVGLGRPSERTVSGLLTPFGKFRLGNNIAVYRPKMMGPYKGEKVEMMRIFGTRWIPFSEEIEDCTDSARGFGIHGVPWEEDSATGELLEERATVGNYVSDGCIRLLTEDVEELFSIIVSRPTVIEIVKEIDDSMVPATAPRA